MPLIWKPMVTTKSLSSLISPCHLTKIFFARLLEHQIFLILLLPFWKFLLTLHKINLFIYSLLTVWQNTFLLFAPLLSDSTSYDNLQWQEFSKCDFRVPGHAPDPFKTPRNKTCNRSSSPQPQTWSSSPILYQPSPQVTQAKTAAGMNSSLYNHQYLYLISLDWISYLSLPPTIVLVAITSLNYNSSLPLLPVSSFPKSILQTAPILDPIPSLILTITTCSVSFSNCRYCPQDKLAHYKNFYYFVENN